MKAREVSRKALSFLLFAALIHISGISAFAQGEDNIKRTTDYDGDGISDLGLYSPTTATYDVRLSSILNTVRAIIGSVGDIPVPGDYNAPGDGLADRATFNRSTALWSFFLSSGEQFTVQFGDPGDYPAPGNYRGNSCTDLGVFDPRTATFTIADCLSPANDTYQVGPVGAIPVVGDFDGDGSDDPSTFDSRTGTWYIRNSSSGTVQEVQFGLPGDIPAPGRYFGDAQTDIAVYRKRASVIVVRRSSDQSGPFVFPFGLPGDRPASADIDGDNRLDLIVYRPGIDNYFLQGSTGANFTLGWLPRNLSRATPLGSSSQPISQPTSIEGGTTGDYTGDTRGDIAIVSAEEELNTWNISELNGTMSTVDFGFSTDTLLSGDTNGDKHAEPIVVRKNTATGLLDWYVYNRDGTSTTFSFGLTSDNRLQIGDYDCDGKDDVAVVRSVNGFLTWFFRLTTGVAVDPVIHGIDSDTVFSGDFNGDQCDELVVARNRDDLGLIQWFFLGLVINYSESIFWGLTATDTPLGLADFTDDGTYDPVIVRNSGGTNTAFVRLENGTGQVLNLGANTGLPFLGYFQQGGPAAVGVYVGAEEKDDARINIYYTNGVVQQIIAPVQFGSNALVPARGSSLFLGEFTDDPIGCDNQRTFRDGSGGFLYKPRSDGVPGHAVVLTPPSFGRNVRQMQVFNNQNRAVAGIQRTKCCPNGNRFHFWLSTRTSTLETQDPLTIKFTMNDGSTNCFPVPNAGGRFD